MALQRLREAAEKAKCELSSSLQVCSFTELTLIKYFTFVLYNFVYVFIREFGSS